MARSTASSEPLTSPTPSPPRSPVPSQKPTVPVPVRAPGFGSDSELSELSDDEEGNQPHHKQEKEDIRNGIGKTRSKSKRVLPGAMWDWAYKKKTLVVDTDANDAVDNPGQEEGEIEQNMDVKDDVSKDDKSKSGPDIPEQHSTTSPENSPHAEAIQKSTVPRQAAHEDSGKGEDEMDLDPVEEPVKKPPARPTSVADDDPPHDNAPTLENDDDDDDDEHSASEPENAEEDENEAEDTASVVANDENDEDEDIASSRPSSPAGTDEDGDDPPHPVTKQPSNSLIAPAPLLVPEPPELDGSPEHSEAEDPDPEVEVEPEQDEDTVDVGREGTGVDNGEALAPTAGEPDVDVEESAVHSSRSPTPEPDLLEMPAHRAEALDALALIELKFALLRERLYVEKMEELVEEEGMILNGNLSYHHLHFCFLK